MIKRLRLPIHAEVLDLNGLMATLEHPAEVEFSREVSREELAELLVANGRTDLLSMLNHEIEGAVVTYSPITAERVETTIAEQEPDNDFIAQTSGSSPHSFPPIENLSIDNVQMLKEAGSENDNYQADIEDLATEAQVRADLEEKSIAELVDLADELKIEIPKNVRKKAEYVETILPHIGTKEAMDKILAEEKAKENK